MLSCGHRFRGIKIPDQPAHARASPTRRIWQTGKRLHPRKNDAGKALVCLSRRDRAATTRRLIQKPVVPSAVRCICISADAMAFQAGLINRFRRVNRCRFNSSRQSSKEIRGDKQGIQRTPVSSASVSGADTPDHRRIQPHRRSSCHNCATRTVMTAMVVSGQLCSASLKISTANIAANGSR